MMRPLALAVVGCLALAGCTSTPAPSPGTATPTSEGTSAAPQDTPSPTGPPSTPIGLPSATSSAPAPTDWSSPPTEPPEAPLEPAPSTAGSLDENDVPVAPGWSPTALPGSAEEGFLGNGTWVHAASPEYAAHGALALGCAEIGSYPQPTAALEGTLVGPSGAPGIGLTLEFASDDDARAFFAQWLSQAEACVGKGIEKISATEDTWVGRRLLETTWSETAGVRGETVRLLIVNDESVDLSGAIDG